MFWQCGSYRLECSKPLIMGVINLHPASFVSQSYCASLEEVLNQAEAMVSAGADILDLGAEPTNPSIASVPVSAEQELVALLPLVFALSQHFDIPISVDTSAPKVMDAVLDAGASIINDVRALNVEGAVNVLARYSAGVCLMHRGQDSSIKKIAEFLRNKAKICQEAGIAKERIVLDPGIGAGSFGKNLPQNLALLKSLNVLKAQGFPILVGVSRKSFIGELLDLPVEERLAGSLAAAIVAYQQGASILRVHDVAPTVQALKMVKAISQSQEELR